MDVAITGVGVVSAVGNDVATFGRNLELGNVEIVAAPWADPEAGRWSWVSPVRDFTAGDWMDARVEEGSDRFTHFALAAAVQAVADHGAPLDPLRTGVVLGTTMAGARALLEAQYLLDTKGPEAVPRKLNIQAWPNMAAGQVAQRWKLHGPLLTVSTACASSLDAIGTAGRLVHSGVADVVRAGGTESGLCAALYDSQAAYGMSQPVTDPRRASLPFDVCRSGIVEGEAAGVVVLENLARAQARGARIYGLVRGYASISDGYHPSSPDPSGEWEVRAMRLAQEDAGLVGGAGREAIDAVIAHGTGTPQGDLAEITAINTLFAGRERDLPVTSVKGNIGHTGAAAGVINVLAALHGMDHDCLVHTAGTTEPEPSAEFTVVIDRPLDTELRTVQVNAFGFGGQDASLVLTRA
jgi:3-oxoacyl-[acyl-carrier-protein] synthase II